MTYLGRVGHMTSVETETSGSLVLSTPWARGAIRDPEERLAIAARIPHGYAINIGAARSQTDWSIRVLDLSLPAGSDPVHALFHVRDLRRGIDMAIEWCNRRERSMVVTTDAEGWVTSLEDAS